MIDSDISVRRCPSSVHGRGERARRRRASGWWCSTRRARAAAIAPGSSCTCASREGADFILRRPFSVHRAEAGRLEILYQVLGRGTRVLPRPRRGAVMDAIGPLGHGWWVARGRRTRAARGRRARRRAHGHARGGARRARRGDDASHMGAPTADRLLARDLFEPRARRTEVATDDGIGGHLRVRDRTHRRLMTTDRPDVVYVCGPEPMQRDRGGPGGRGRHPVPGVARAAHGVRCRRVPVVRGDDDERPQARVRGRPGLRRRGGAVGSVRGPGGTGE